MGDWDLMANMISVLPLVGHNARSQNPPRNLRQSLVFCHPCKPCKPTIIVVQPQVICPKPCPKTEPIRDCDEVKVCGKNVQINLFSIVKNCVKN